MQRTVLVPEKQIQRNSGIANKITVTYTHPSITLHLPKCEAFDCKIYHEKIIKYINKQPYRGDWAVNLEKLSIQNDLYLVQIFPHFRPLKCEDKPFRKMQSKNVIPIYKKWFYLLNFKKITVKKFCWKKKTRKC